jgi:hypothetical protein
VKVRCDKCNVPVRSPQRAMRVIKPTGRMARWFEACEQHPDWEKKILPRGPTPMKTLGGWRRSL